MPMTDYTDPEVRFPRLEARIQKHGSGFVFFLATALMATVSVLVAIKLLN